MAGTFRTIQMETCQDPWFDSLTPYGKWLYVYLFTNRCTSATGLYNIPLKVIAMETGIDKRTISKLLQEFWSAGKILYNDRTMWVFNMEKYQIYLPKEPGLPGKKNSTLVRLLRDINKINSDEVKSAYMEAHGYAPSVQLPDTEASIINTGFVLRMRDFSLIQAQNILPPVIRDVTRDVTRDVIPPVDSLIPSLTLNLKESHSLPSSGTITAENGKQSPEEEQAQLQEFRRIQAQKKIAKY